MSNKKVLIIRLGAIGDVIHSVMLAQSIKKAEPTCEVHFMTSDFIVPLLENNPHIDKVINYTGYKRNDYLYMFLLGLKLRKEHYDMIFPLSNSIRNYFMMYVANPKRIVKRNNNRIHAVDAFYNTACDVWGKIEKPENLEIFINKNSTQKMTDRFAKLSKPFVVISPGGANDLDRQGRIWVDDKWIELGNQLVEKYGVTIFVCGSDKEKENHQKYRKIKNAKILSGELTLEESAALYSISDLFISGDSGPLHIASALDINVIGIMGSTPTYACSPYGQKGFVVEPNSDCKFCEQTVCAKLPVGEKFTPCMQSINVCDILNLIEEKDLL